MIVLDASLVVELLTNRSGLAAQILHDTARHRDSFIAPHLLVVEVLSARRRLEAGQRLDAFRAEQMRSDLMALPVEPYSHERLIDRIWEFRHNFTAYDAAYVALAEAMGATLFTCDAKLTGGHRARVAVSGF